MKQNITICIVAKGNVRVEEDVTKEDIVITSSGKNYVSFDTDMVYVNSDSGSITVKIPVGQYECLYIAQVLGNLELDLPRTMFNHVDLYEVSGVMSGNVRYKNIQTQECRGANYINKKKPASYNTSVNGKANHLSVKHSFSRNQKPYTNDRTKNKEWGW